MQAGTQYEIEVSPSKGLRSLFLDLSQVRSLDWFAATNATLFVLLCIFTYWDRFVAYRGAGNAHEFMVYAISILSAIGGLWWHFRRFSFSSRLLLLIEIGILMHFAGAFVKTDTGRLYDTYLLGIRYDKLVHFTNAFGGVFLINSLFRHRKIVSNGLNALFVIFIVLGCGAVVEIIEYLVTLTVPHNGVGDYDNNMQDLIGNFCGALAAALIINGRIVTRTTKA